MKGMAIRALCPSETPTPTQERKAGNYLRIPTRLSLHDSNLPEALRAQRGPRGFPAGGSGSSGCGSAGAPRGPARAPRAALPAPGRAEAPAYLSEPSAAGVAGSAGGPGPGPGGGGWGCRAWGERQGEDWWGWHGAQGRRRGSWQPQGLRADRAETVWDFGGAAGPGPGDRGLPPGAGGALQPAGPARKPGGARIRGAVFSPRLTNQSGPAEPELGELPPRLARCPRSLRAAS
jgi:hypothetical protein